jgi:hypothetical protein
MRRAAMSALSPLLEDERIHLGHCETGAVDPTLPFSDGSENETSQNAGVFFQRYRYALPVHAILRRQTDLP